MRTRFSVGPFFGVRVVVTLSWLIVLAIVVVALEMLGIFSAELPQAGRLGLAALVGLLFLLSLAVHELAHAFVARRVGLPVSEVRLAVIGSQGELEKSPPRGRGDVAIALAGPLVSLLIGGLAMAASLSLGVPPDPWVAGLAEVVWLVGLSNLLIGGLNLLPGHPFDGGRIVRGVVMERTGDANRAARLSLQAGRLLSFAMMGLGIALALSGRFIDGIWLVVLGWLLVQSNKLHVRRVEVEQLVSGLVVSDVMARDFSVVPPSLTIDALLDQHQQAGDDAPPLYPVTHHDELLGAVEVKQLERMGQGERQATRVEDVMTARDRLPVLTREVSVMDALQSFDRTRAEALPVIDDGYPPRVVGMLSRGGLVRALRARRAAPRAPEPAG
jgi:Zn-dependent protease